MPALSELKYMFKLKMPFTGLFHEALPPGCYLPNYPGFLFPVIFIRTSCGRCDIQRS